MMISPNSTKWRASSASVTEYPDFVMFAGAGAIVVVAVFTVAGAVWQH